MCCQTVNPKANVRAFPLVFQGEVEILKHFEMLIGYNATRGCEYT
jgi:hypothetical protein